MATEDLHPEADADFLRGVAVWITGQMNAGRLRDLEWQATADFIGDRGVRQYVYSADVGEQTLRLIFLEGRTADGMEKTRLGLQLIDGRGSVADEVWSGSFLRDSRVRLVEATLLKLHETVEARIAERRREAHRALLKDLGGLN